MSLAVYISRSKLMETVWALVPKHRYTSRTQVSSPHPPCGFCFPGFLFLASLLKLGSIRIVPGPDLSLKVRQTQRAESCPARFTIQPRP